ncbi:unnamed protein product [Auanema sp. JU1783]|nr:unnamed protein product [Auanema sp. JU1783]
MSDFLTLPPEIIRNICLNLSLSDVESFSHVHPILELVIPNVFFRDMKRLHIDWNSEGVALTFSGNSLDNDFSITTSTHNWEEVVEYSNYVEEIIITKTDDAKDYHILEVIAAKQYKLKNLEIRLRSGKRSVSKHTINYMFVQMTSFVGKHRSCLDHFRLETNADNFIEFYAKPEATIRYSHEYDMAICNQLIIPLFNVMLRDRQGMTSVTLQINCKTKAALALQTAFQAALPFEHRVKVQVLRLEFGTCISQLSEEEMHTVLAAYAPYLNSTRNLQHLICDLSNSMLDPSSLEKLYSVISEELRNDQHRISIITSSVHLTPNKEGASKWSKQVLVS